MFFKPRFERELARVRKRDPEEYRAYAEADWLSLKAPLSEARFLSVDLELDGLQRGSRILQMGWVALDAQSITLTDARSIDIFSDATLRDDAVTIHGIGEQRAKEGLALEDALPSFIEALSGRILLAHHAALEFERLRAATRTLYGAPLPIAAVCTLELERRLYPNLTGTEPYRLGPSRARRGLPDYAAHDALTDALATAELFLAQLRELPADTRLDSLLLD